MKSLIPPSIVFHIPQDDDRYYHTRGLYLAAYLSLKRLPLVNVEATSRIVVFTFRDAPAREEWVTAFHQGKPTVNARQFALTICDMHRLMKRAEHDRNVIASALARQ